MRWTLLVLLGLVLVGGLPACGGGGAEEEPTDTCSAPGVLRRLAAVGLPAPGTAGNFAPFPVEPPMNVAELGWAAFVAPTTDLVKTEVAYVVPPDGSVLDAFARGDVVPDADGGTISDILAVRVSAGGRLVVLVAITGDGGGRTRGLLTAVVDGGVVTGKNDLIYNGGTVPDLSGTLADFSTTNLHLFADGYTTFEGITTTAAEGMFRVFGDGTGLAHLVGTGSSMPGGATVDTIEGFAYGPELSLYTFLVKRLDGTPGLYVGQVGNSTRVRVVQDGDPIGADTVASLPYGQPLSVDTSARVLFWAVGASSIDYVCVGASGVEPEPIAIEGATDEWTGGDFANPRWLRNRPGVAAPMLQSSVTPNANGVTFALYGAIDLLADPQLAMWNGRVAPAGLGEGLAFGTIYPGLGGAGRCDVAGVGQVAFANILNSGRPGVWWLLPGCGLFTLAAGGLEAGPDDTFGGGDQWRVTTARDVVLFRAPLVTRGSGIFRRGPN